MTMPRRDPVQLPLFEQETVSVTWVADRLNTTDQTVRRLLEDGKLRGYRLSSQGWWNVSYKSVIEYESELRKQHDPGRKTEDGTW